MSQCVDDCIEMQSENICFDFLHQIFPTPLASTSSITTSISLFFFFQSFSVGGNCRTCPLAWIAFKVMWQSMRLFFSLLSNSFIRMNLGLIVIFHLVVVQPTPKEINMITFRFPQKNGKKMISFIEKYRRSSSWSHHFSPLLFYDHKKVIPFFPNWTHEQRE